MEQFLKKFKSDIIGITWMSIGIFTGLALISYKPGDPSINSIVKSAHVANYCGFLGAILADLFYQALGVSSWAFVGVSIRAGVGNFVKEQVSSTKLKLVWLSLLLLVMASLFALYWPEKRFFNNEILIGGVVGIAITKSLLVALNVAGVSILLWALFLCLVLFIVDKNIKEILSVPKKALTKSLSSFDYLLHFYHSLSFSKFFKKIFYFPVLIFENLIERKKQPALDTGGGRFFRVENNLDPDPVEIRASLIGVIKKRSKIMRPRNDNQPKKRKVFLKRKINRKIENWELPQLDLIKDPPNVRQKIDEKEINRKSHLLINKMEQFNVKGQIVGAKTGPAVTMFEFKPNVNVKISKITELADDLSLALSSESVRIIAPIPGRDVVGIETSNSVRETVYLKDILADDDFWDDELRLPIAMGKQADGKDKIVDLRRMPHLLVAGSTGSGKSVFTVSFLTGLIFRHSPKTLKLILVDPKQVDLATFNEIPHLLMPPIREAKKAICALRWAIKEMEKRYRSMSKFGARGLESFNEKVEKLTDEQIASHESYHEALEEREIIDSYYYEPQPYIVIVVEEFGDLMAVDKSNVEQAVVRLAQMARACGIHLVLAMQSPRKDVVTGLIKTNIPGRISFKVASKMDSRIILDESGAERLLSRGDMLFLAPGLSKPARHHGPWLSDDEINEVTNYWRAQGEPEYDQLAMRALDGSGGGFNLGGPEGSDNDYDERYDEILAWVSKEKTVSASLLQRKFKLGYPRAARMIECFESEGVVGPPQGSKPRKVLVNSYE